MEVRRLMAVEEWDAATCYRQWSVAEIRLGTASTATRGLVHMETRVRCRVAAMRDMLVSSPEPLTWRTISQPRERKNPLSVLDIESVSCTCLVLVRQGVMRRIAGSFVLL